MQRYISIFDEEIDWSKKKTPWDKDYDPEEDKKIKDKKKKPVKDYSKDKNPWE